MPGDWDEVEFPAAVDFGNLQTENRGARRIQHPSPPRPGLERLLKESAEKIKNMSEEAHRKMIEDQVKNIMPFVEDRQRQVLGRFVELSGKVAAGLKEENVKRDELRVGRVTPLTINDGDRKGLTSGGCVKGHPFTPMFPRPLLDLERLERERQQHDEEAAREFEKKYETMDDLSRFEKEVREARCPICGGREGCDHSQEERIREFARAGMRAQAKIEQKAKDDGPFYQKAEAVLDVYLDGNRHGCHGTPAATKDTTLAQPRILIVVSNEREQFRLNSLIDDSRFLVVLPVDAVPISERFAAVIVACRSHIHELDCDLGRKLERDTLRAWLNALRYVTVNRDLKDVIYL